MRNARTSSTWEGAKRFASGVTHFTNVPSDLIVALNGLVVVFVVSLEYLRRRARASEVTDKLQRATSGSAPPVVASPVEASG